jgi:ribosomal protein S18 acetylase RimI-like enzyme
MQIRPMHQEDMQAVSDVLCSCYRWLADREGYTPEQVNFLLHQRGSLETVRRESREQLYLVASQHGAIVGMVSVSGSEVTKLYVSPSHHHRGIGAALLRAAASAIAESGFGTMSLGTTPSTVPFYESLGMSIARTRRPSRGPFTDRDVVVMTMALDESAEAWRGATA